MVVLAGMILLAETARHHARAESALLLGLLVLVGLAARWLLHDLRLHPANFPPPTTSSGLRLRPEPAPSKSGARTIDVGVVDRGGIDDARRSSIPSTR